MKTIIFLCSLFLCSCSSPIVKDRPIEKEVVYSYTTIKKVVKGKSQEQTSSQSRHYSLWNDQFYNETQLFTLYYIAYTDGSTEKVDARKYALYDKGDTISKVIKVKQK